METVLFRIKCLLTGGQNVPIPTDPYSIEKRHMTLEEMWEFAHTHIQNKYEDTYRFLLALENNQNDM